jgi:hypothetical protein
MTIEENSITSEIRCLSILLNYVEHTATIPKFESKIYCSWFFLSKWDFRLRLTLRPDARCFFCEREKMIHKHCWPTIHRIGSKFSVLLHSNFLTTDVYSIILLNLFWSMLRHCVLMCNGCTSIPFRDLGWEWLFLA